MRHLSVRVRSALMAAWHNASITPRVIALIWRASPAHACTEGLLNIVRGVCPVMLLWLTKLIVDTVVGVGGADPAARGHRLTWLVVAFAIVLVAQDLGGVLRNIVDANFRDLFAHRISLELLTKINCFPGLSLFETPSFYDKLRNAEEGTGSNSVSLLDMLSGAFTSLLTLCGVLALLARLHWGIVAVLLAASAPALIVHFAMWYKTSSVFFQQAPEARRLAYYGTLLKSPIYAKETRLFGLSDHFLSRYIKIFRGLYAENRRVRSSKGRWSLLITCISALSVAGCYAYIAFRALSADLTAGDVAMYAGATTQASYAIFSVVNCLAFAYANNRYIEQFLQFLALPSDLCSPTSSLAPGLAPGEGAHLRVEGVSFRYPGQRRLALKEVSFDLPPGRSLAIVGENGAGKTTLVKLLARLYDPTEGTITLNGYPLADYDLDALRGATSVVLQDFSRYALTAHENIGLGSLPHLENRGRVEKAARAAGCHALIEALPAGYGTLLGREFEGGTDLSGGEWQRLAIARAFMRDAPLLILDEPTASLDPRMEYEVYQRFDQLTSGRTTILISHRFSTVRMADQILVLSGGRVVESGSHDRLMREDGLYAEMFTMQVSRYQA